MLFNEEGERVSAPTTSPHIWASARAIFIIISAIKMKSSCNFSSATAKICCNIFAGWCCPKMCAMPSAIWPAFMTCRCGATAFYSAMSMPCWLEAPSFWVSTIILPMPKCRPCWVELLTQLNKEGIIRADATAMNDLALNIWMITKYWFDFDGSLRGRAKLTEDSKVRGVQRTLSLLRPLSDRKPSGRIRPNARCFEPDFRLHDAKRNELSHPEYATGKANFCFFLWLFYGRLKIK